MTIIDPATGWFEITKVPTYDLKKVTVSNDEFVDKSSTRFRQLFNNIWLIRYPHPCKVMFYNGYGFKQKFNPLLKVLDIKPVLTTIKNHKLTLQWSGCNK